jgi:hypothetical protein
MASTLPPLQGVATASPGRAAGTAIRHARPQGIALSLLSIEDERLDTDGGSGADNRGFPRWSVAP